MVQSAFAICMIVIVRNIQPRPADYLPLKFEVETKVREHLLR